MHRSTARLLVAASLSLVALSWAAPAAASRPEVGCRACLVIDDTGRELFARAAGERRPNASTTKMVTALLVRAATELDERVTVSAVAAATGGGTLDLQAGESYRVHELLQAMLMASSNDAAVALAEHVAGSEAGFVRRMNRFAIDILDLADTRFVTAHGLDQPGHYSSARDLAGIALEVLSDPVLARIVATRRTTIDGPTGDVEVENRNLLLESYEGLIGVKTGYTLGAGNVLVAAAERKGRRLIAVAMGSDDSFDDTRRLLDHGFARLARTVLLGSRAVVGALVFDGSGSVEVVAGRAVRGAVPPDDVRIRYEPTDGVVFPVVPGERMGSVLVTYRGRTVGRVPALASAGVDRPGTSWAGDVVAGLIGLLAGLFAGAARP